MTRPGVERFDAVVEHLREALRSLDGGYGGRSQLNRPELHPGFGELQHHVALALSHLEQALVWAEEMGFIIDRELLPEGMRAERGAA